jgi:hypothetical protein
MAVGTLRQYCGVKSKRNGTGGDLNVQPYQFEQLLNMGDGYVLNFSNRTFDEFALDSIGRNIYDWHYGSKATRLRAFWREEVNGVVRKLMGQMLDYGVGCSLFTDKDELLEAFRRAVARLLQDSPVAELNALVAISDEKDFDRVANAVRDAIEKNEPESGLDRLHTFVMKYVRTLCTRHGVAVTRDKPLHSLFGGVCKATAGWRAY